MTFRIGQKVVCVVDYGSNQWGICPPKKGHVYTVREFDDRGSKPGLRVCEIVNTPCKHIHMDGLIEPAFAVADFRPVVGRKTDISIFTSMLNPSKVNA